MTMTVSYNKMCGQLGKLSDGWVSFPRYLNVGTPTTESLAQSTFFGPGDANLQYMCRLVGFSRRRGSQGVGTGTTV